MSIGNGKPTEVSEEVGMAIFDFWAVWCGHQDTRDLLQGRGPICATVRIGDMSHYSTHRKDYGKVSPLSGLLDYGQTTEEGHGR